MMTKRNVLLICSLCFLTAAMSDNLVQAQQVSQDKVREGYYEITLKSPDKRRINIDELVRDRDLNPAALYRVKTGGYLAFDESEWVDGIEFKVHDVPVTDLPLYKRFAELLSEINQKIWDIKELLGRYDIMALHLMNICDRKRFSDLQAVDENIIEYLTTYKKLELLRSLAVNSLNRFVKERSCRDQFADYSKTLDIYRRQLGEVTKNADRLSRRALNLSQEVKASPEAPRPEPPSAPGAERRPTRQR
ncbi:MAG: hypothetical protein HY912_08300 [Desulfomonile tiedjei]|uniref:Uncharacterized protein n=1 Tax=Desulfomonile tiedjei TaxID=2358 RepID=A0A9D6Z354_9BACT|nr:hypothetical protein [Desulfomonile tiedjei]